MIIDDLKRRFPRLKFHAYIIASEDATLVTVFRGKTQLLTVRVPDGDAAVVGAVNNLLDALTPRDEARPQKTVRGTGDWNESPRSGDTRHGEW